jgi:hypothetical protein
MHFSHSSFSGSVTSLNGGSLDKATADAILAAAVAAGVGGDKVVKMKKDRKKNRRGSAPKRSSKHNRSKEVAQLPPGAVDTDTVFKVKSSAKPFADAKEAEKRNKALLAAVNKETAKGKNESGGKKGRDGKDASGCAKRRGSTGSGALEPKPPSRRASDVDEEAVFGRRGSIVEFAGEEVFGMLSSDSDDDDTMAGRFASSMLCFV